MKGKQYRAATRVALAGLARRLDDLTAAMVEIDHREAEARALNDQRQNVSAARYLAFDERLTSLEREESPESIAAILERLERLERMAAEDRGAALDRHHATNRRIDSLTPADTDNHSRKV